MASEKVSVTLALDSKQFKSGMAEAKQSFNSVSKAGASMGSALKKVGTIVASAFAVQKVVEFGRECINVGSDVQEMRNKFSVVFGDMADDVESWADSYGKAIGRSKYAMMEATANISDLAVGMGMQRDAAAELSKQYVELALDLGSFNNVSDTTALEAMTKAMFGETEMAKQLGLNLNVTTMEQNEYVKSLGKSFSKLTQQEKAMAYLNEAMRQSPNAIGDAKRSLDSYASQVKRSEGATYDLKAAVGEYLLPVMTPVVAKFAELKENLTDCVKKFGEAYQKTKSITESLYAIDGRIRPIIDGFKSLSQVFVNEFMGIFGPHLEDFKALFDNTVSAFTESSGELQEAFTTLSSLFKEVYESAIKPTIDSFCENIKIVWEAFNLAIPHIIEIWNLLCDVISTLFTTIIAPVLQGVRDGVTMVRTMFEHHLPEAGRVFDELVTTIKDLWNTVLKPVFEAIKWVLENVLAPVFSLVLAAIGATVLATFKFIAKIWDSILKPVLDAIVTVVKSVANAISDIWNNHVKPLLNSITTFVSGVFSGNWRKAWEGVKGIFKSVFSSLAGIVKPHINAIISLVNKAINGINKMVSAVNKVPGLSIPTIPNIPKLWKGAANTKAGLTLVGERGPELVNMGSGHTVYPAHVTRSILAGAGRDLRNHQAETRTANIIVELDGRTLAKAVGQPLLDQLHVTAGLAF